MAGHSQVPFSKLLKRDCVGFVSRYERFLPEGFTNCVEVVSLRIAIHPHSKSEKAVVRSSCSFDVEIPVAVVANSKDSAAESPAVSRRHRSSAPPLVVPVLPDSLTQTGCKDWTVVSSPSGSGGCAVLRPKWYGAVRQGSVTWTLNLRVS